MVSEHSWPHERHTQQDGSEGDTLRRQGGIVRNRWLSAMAIGVTVLVGAGMTACTSHDDSANRSAKAQRVEQAAVATPPKLTINPGDHAQNVSPTQAVGLRVENGTISDVALTNPEGEKVKGEMAEDKRSWNVAEPLGYGKIYTWSGTATGAAGKQAKISGAFQTVTPDYEIGGQLNVGDGATYGVAMPIVINFDSPVTDKASVQKRLKVQTSNQTEGDWAWLDDYSVHWRPKSYWEPNTNVKVTGNLYGAPMGDGAYGTEDLNAQFSIGRDQRVRANVESHHIALFRDQKRVAVFPASFGLDSDPGRVTRGGTHVVMSKAADYYMTNRDYGYENVHVQYAVRISNNGEFIHAYPGSEYAQGNSNVSHGCINLSTTNGLTYFNFAQVGDPVEVVNSSVPMSASDGDYHDWTVDWNTWKSKSAL
jgi:lipoprotein-anchoring transpeptidase ErfK/SrfK